MRLARSVKMGVVAFSLLSLGLTPACVKKVDPSSPDVAQAPEGKQCPPAAMVSDAEANNNQVNVQEGRGGYWYTFVDKAGSTVTPTAGEQGGIFEMTKGGANGSQFAARMNGTIGSGNVLFAGMGLNFTDPKGPYDASKYKGIAFFAKKAPGSAASVRVKVPDSNTDPDGKVCTECFNDFGADLELTDEWQRYTLVFDRLRQMQGWGSPILANVKPDAIYGIQFQVNKPGATFDIWVDDVQFTGCP